MGYLNNNQITVDAILTRRGRELLARGRNEFQITHFALADDEIDYSLWNTSQKTSYQTTTYTSYPLKTRKISLKILTSKKLLIY